jgi:hypothetical protein
LKKSLALLVQKNSRDRANGRARAKGRGCHDRFEQQSERYVNVREVSRTFSPPIINGNPILGRRGCHDRFEQQVPRVSRALHSCFQIRHTHNRIALSSKCRRCGQQKRCTDENQLMTLDSFSSTCSRALQRASIARRRWRREFKRHHNDVPALVGARVDGAVSRVFACQVAIFPNAFVGGGLMSNWSLEPRACT